LLAALASVPEFRGRQGRRHPLAAVLAATLCGLLTGARGCNVIAAWIREQQASFWHWLGFQRIPPCANTYRNVLSQISPAVLEEHLRAWIAAVLPEPLPTEVQPVALDGKSLCGTLHTFDRCIHLLALFDQRTGGVLGQLAMPPDTNEHKAALALLKELVKKGQLITGDAMFCQRDVCQQIVDADADYLLIVKDNQPELKAALEAEFQPGFSPL
jgi:hypothetical protein